MRNQIEKGRRRKPLARINSHIRSPEVRVIDEKGDMLGIRSLNEALRLAEDAGVDLIEVAPNAKPPVCKIGSYSKFVYEKIKKSKESRKNRSASHVKEVRFRIKIGEHDFNVKTKHIVEFLKHRHKVRVSIIFYGREMQHRDLGDTMLKKIEEQIQGVGIIEQRPQMYGNRMISILVPQK